MMLQLGLADRPNTPTSNHSWAGSQMSLNSQQTGIKNLQKSIDETSKIKQEVWLVKHDLVGVLVTVNVT